MSDDELLTGDGEIAKSLGYSPMPTAQDLAPAAKEYSAETDGLRDAAKDLAEARQAGRVPQAESESEPLERRYHENGGLGDAMDPHLTVEPRRAADDLAAARAAEFEAAQQQSDLGAAVDQVRQAYANSQQPQTEQLQQPEQQAQPQQSHHEQQAQGTQPDPMPDVHPDVQAALQNVHVREALSKEVQATEAARAQYQQAALAAARVAASSLLSEHPELAQLSDAEIPVALSIVAKTDPQKAMAINAKLDRVRQLFGASQQAEAAQRQIQAQRVEQWAKAEDAKFEAQMAKEPPAKVRAVKESALQVLERDYGLDRAALTHLMQTTPAFRSAEAQRLMYDAVAYRIAQREVVNKVDRSAPPVVRPGVSVDRNANDSGVELALAKFRSNPNPRTAADLLTAKREASRR